MVLLSANDTVTYYALIVNLRTVGGDVEELHIENLVQCNMILRDL